MLNGSGGFRLFLLRCSSLLTRVFLSQSRSNTRPPATAVSAAPPPPPVESAPAPKLPPLWPPLVQIVTINMLTQLELACYISMYPIIHQIVASIGEADIPSTFLCPISEELMDGTCNAPLILALVTSN